MACLRDWFATLFDHCKYEFRLFLYRELKWSSILRELDVNPRHLGGIWGSAEFSFCSEKQGSWWISHVTLTFCMIWHDSLFARLSSGLFSMWNIQEDTKEGRKLKTTINFPQSVKRFPLTFEPQGHCLIHLLTAWSSKWTQASGGSGGRSVWICSFSSSNIKTCFLSSRGLDGRETFVFRPCFVSHRDEWWGLGNAGTGITR